MTVEGIEIDTNQNVQINYVIASLGERILAALVDLAIISGLVFVLFILGDLLNSVESIGVLAILFSIPILFYPFICEMTMDGQSFGKRWLKIKVIKRDGSKASIANYFLRFLLFPIDSFYFIGVAVIFLNRKGQRLGDLAAGTTVVKVQQKVSLSDVVSTDTRPNRTISYPEVVQLKDKDIRLIRDILNKRKRDVGHKSIHLLSIKIKEVLNVKMGSLTDYQFLTVIVKDFEASYSKEEV